MSERDYVTAGELRRAGIFGLPDRIPDHATTLRSGLRAVVRSVDGDPIEAPPAPD